MKLQRSQCGFINYYAHNFRDIEPLSSCRVQSDPPVDVTSFVRPLTKHCAFIKNVQCFIMAENAEGSRILSTIIEEVAASLDYAHLKEEQKKAQHAFITGNDVFVSLPTRYGKSLCYASCMPMPL